tara:strand:- start:648 stop:818 length:171 start_codon:yes stop_codon:yes gene_type:complete
MRVLITGNLDYVRSVLTDILIQERYEVVGLDIGFLMAAFCKRKPSLSHKFTKILEM